MQIARLYIIFSLFIVLFAAASAEGLRFKRLLRVHLSEPVAGSSFHAGEGNQIKLLCMIEIAYRSVAVIDGVLTIFELAPPHPDSKNLIPKFSLEGKLIQEKITHQILVSSANFTRSAEPGIVFSVPPSMRSSCGVLNLDIEDFFSEEIGIHIELHPVQYQTSSQQGLGRLLADHLCVLAGEFNGKE
jgi:hypothetical protein